MTELVAPPGFEPGTRWLQTRTSASWVTGPPRVAGPGIEPGAGRLMRAPAGPPAPPLRGGSDEPKPIAPGTQYYAVVSVGRIEFQPLSGRPAPHEHLGTLVPGHRAVVHGEPGRFLRRRHDFPPRPQYRIFLAERAIRIKREHTTSCAYAVWNPRILVITQDSP